jgi:Asp-tRNA(Asn)/Glu-tRNA(Gln) amidotransferase A subunit family amidase
MTEDEARRRLLQRIRIEDGCIHAFVHLAEEAGVEASGQTLHLPLADLPVAVKDIMDTAAMPTGYGSRAYPDYRPPRDAAVVTALKELGAFIVGKTTTTEFATSPPTATLNPRDTRRTPGGSSAGSAAAVAAGLVSAALGTQTLGSVIRPASFCGVVGFKPTYGWFPCAGVKMLAPSLDTIGFLTRRVLEAARLYKALSPGEEEAVDPPSIRYAFVRDPNWTSAAPDARAAIEECVDRLRGMNMSVSDIEMPEGFSGMTEIAGAIHDYEMRRTLLPELRAAHDKLDPTLVERIEHAARFTAADHRHALRTAEAQRERFAVLMRSFDAILCLAAAGEAPLGLSSIGAPVMNAAWTALHVPCLTLPAMHGATGLPIGLQLVADRYRDVALLSIATKLERSLAI